MTVVLFRKIFLPIQHFLSFECMLSRTSLGPHEGTHMNRLDGRVNRAIILGPDLTAFDEEVR